GKGSWADIHASDPRSDLAVLSLQQPPAGLRAITFGDGGKVKKGQFVIGLANPFAAGFRDGSPSASCGIISNLRRRAPGPVSEVNRARVSFHHFGTLIQTDVRLNTGCSGGALLKLDGELIGLTSALAALAGVETPGGFAIPLDGNTRRIINVLARGEEVEYGFLGVSLTPPSRSSPVVQLSAVIGGSPAQLAGVSPNDSVVSINGEPVRENDDLFLLVGSQLAGSEVTLELEEYGTRRRRTIGPIRLAKYYVTGSAIASRRPAARGGLRVDYASVLAQRDVFRQSIPRGVIVREIIPHSPAEKIQLLQPDRIIRRVNGEEVNTPAEFYRQMDKANGQAELTVLNADQREERVTLALR
ncbi:MAG: PDZ domain-containing protein, partial [Candidatus Acidiferrum sp.]